MPLTPPTAQTITQGMAEAQTDFATAYPGDIYYRAAKASVQQGISNRNAVEIATGVAVLLINWNTGFYTRQERNQRYQIQGALVEKEKHQGSYFSQDYLKRIKELMENLLRDYQPELVDFSRRSIDGIISSMDEQNIKEIFKRLQDVLGPVGAGMNLSLIGPDFFPFWNNSIAKAYGQGELEYEYNQNKYFRFMESIRNVKSQLGPNISLKALDEYNWMTY